MSPPSRRSRCGTSLRWRCWWRRPAAGSPGWTARRARPPEAGWPATGRCTTTCCPFSAPPSNTTERPEEMNGDPGQAPGADRDPGHTPDRDPGHTPDPDLPDESWNAQARDETTEERLDRNFLELLQELRVAQAGVQILFAFLLSLAFTQRFDKLNHVQRDVYIVALVASAVAAALFIAPVAWHRLLFRRRRKEELVSSGNQMALAGLAALLVSVAASVLLIVDVTLGPVPAIVITVLVTIWYLLFWYALPIRSRFQARKRR